MAAACLISSDVSSLTLLNGQGAPSWSADPALRPPVGAAGTPTPARESDELRARAESAAAFVLAHPGVRRRLDLVCVDVETSRCLFLRAPGEQEAALGAAVRSADQDWGDAVGLGSVEALGQELEPNASTAPAPLKVFGVRVGSGPAPAPALSVPTTAIACPDALIFLWLDALDRRGVRTGPVLSLWHAAALAWATTPAGALQDQRITGVVIRDGSHRLIWSWSRGHNLIAGGSVRLDGAGQEPDGPDPAASPSGPAHDAGAGGLDGAVVRLALDWVAWATQLGLTPDRLVIAGPHADALAARLSRRWPPTETVLIEDPAPLQTTVRKAADAIAQSDPGADPRRCLRRLSARPTRAVRRQYQWAAAGLILAAGGLGVLGYRMMASARELGAASSQVSARGRELVGLLNEPRLLEKGSLELTLDSRLAELKNQGKGTALPPDPRPIYAELQRLLQAMSGFSGVRLTTVTIDARGNSNLQLSTPDLRTGEEILLRLQTSDAPLAWSNAGSVGIVEQQLRLNGVWIR